MILSKKLGKCTTVLACSGGYGEDGVEKFVKSDKFAAGVSFFTKGK
jgi:hypothetical protein